MDYRSNLKCSFFNDFAITIDRDTAYGIHHSSTALLIFIEINTKAFAKLPYLIAALFWTHAEPTRLTWTQSYKTFQRSAVTQM